MIKTTTKNYSYLDFNLKNEPDCIKKTELSVSEAYNINISQNTIEPLAGFADYFESTFSNETLDQIKNKELTATFCYAFDYSYFDSTDQKRTRHFFIDGEGTLYELSLDELEFKKQSIKFKGSVQPIYRDSHLYLYSPNDKLIEIRNGLDPMYVLSFFNIYAYAECKNTAIFACTEHRYKLLTSPLMSFDNYGSKISNFSVTDLDQSNGEVLALCTINGSIYVVQEYAISKLQVQNMSVSISSVFCLSSKIAQGTAVQVDDLITFLTDSGVYIFDGLNLKCITTKIRKNSDKTTEKAVVFNHNYYILCNYNFSDEECRALVSISPNKENFSVYKFKNIEDIYTLQSSSSHKLIVRVSNEDASKSKLKELNLSKFFESKKLIKFNKLFFDESTYKTLTEAQVYAHGKFDFKISSDIDSVCFSISENAKLRSIGLRGNTFEIEISGQDYFKIEAIILSITQTSESL